MPSRRPGAFIDQPGAAAAGEPPSEHARQGAVAAVVAPLSAASLKRVLDGLRRLT